MINEYEVILRLLLGAFFGGIIGFERQSHGRPAGFRTHLLVCLASVLIMIVSIDYYSIIAVDSSFVRIDPARIAAGAITGIGFLGAGVIIKSGFTIQGLTTAACLWIVSAIGLAVGGGLYLHATVGFIITFFSLWVLRKVEGHVPRMKYKLVTVVTDSTELADIRKILSELNIDISEIDYDIDWSKGETVYNIHAAFRKRQLLLDMIDKLKSLKGLKRLTIRG